MCKSHINIIETKSRFKIHQILWQQTKFQLHHRTSHYLVPKMSSWQINCFVLFTWYFSHNETWIVPDGNIVLLWANEDNCSTNSITDIHHIENEFINYYQNLHPYMSIFSNSNTLIIRSQTRFPSFSYAVNMTSLIPFLPSALSLVL